VLDIKLIRSEPDKVRAGLARRGEQDAAAVDQVLALDERWRSITAQLEKLRAQQPHRCADSGGARGACIAGCAWPGTE
jgi:seryl-tRNA synthetase